MDYRHAVELADRGATAAAAKALLDLARRNPGWLPPRLKLAEIALAQRNLVPTADLAELLGPHVGEPRTARLAEALAGERGTDAALEPLADALISAGTHSAKVWRAKLGALARRSDWRGLSAAAQQLFALPDALPAQIAGARILVRHGEAARVRAFVAVATASADDRQELEELGAFAADGGGQPYKGSGNVVVSRARQPRATVVVFPGLNHNAGVTLEHLHVLLARMCANVVSLTDPQRLFFLCGLDPLGEDYKSAAEGLSSLLRQLAAPRNLVLGSSAGGFAAIRYAIDISEVDACLVGGAPTTLDPRDPIVSVGARATAALARLDAHAPERRENLRAPLLARRPPLPLTCVFGEGYAKDRGHAENLAGVPGVALAPIPGYAGHDAFTHLAATGKLEPLLEEFVVAPAGRSAPDS
jgi:hypothetical protein